MVNDRPLDVNGDNRGLYWQGFFASEPSLLAAPHGYRGVCCCCAICRLPDGSSVAIR